jgi:hypothetical protein
LQLPRFTLAKKSVFLSRPASSGAEQAAIKKLTAALQPPSKDKIEKPFPPFPLFVEM